MTEEVWSWWQEGSIHRASWPVAAELGGLTGDPSVLPAVAATLAGIRGAKSNAKVSMRTELTSVTVTGPVAALALAELASEDLRAAGKITGDLTFTPGNSSEIQVDAVVAPPIEG